MRSPFHGHRVPKVGPSVDTPGESNTRRLGCPEGGHRRGPRKTDRSEQGSEDESLVTRQGLLHPTSRGTLSSTPKVRRGKSLPRTLPSLWVEDVNMFLDVVVFLDSVLEEKQDCDPREGGELESGI